MKNLLMLCAAALLLSGAAGAQTTPDGLRVRFDTPVIASGTELPAGNYEIRLIPSNTGNAVLSVRSETGGHSVLLVNPVRLHGDAGDKGASVVLGRRGTEYVLQQVWLSDQMGFEPLQ
jgi:hypothetical protein